MEELIKQIDKEIAAANDSAKSINHLIKNATNVRQLVNLGRLLSEAHGEINGLHKAKKIILGGVS